MSEVVKRSYDASGRQAQARATRMRIVEIARRRFLELGYHATTVPDIAAEAGISVKTVYKAYGNKPGLLKAVLDVAIAGDDEPVAIPDRSFIAEIVATTDPRRKFELYASQLATSMARAAPVALLVRGAASSDPELQALHRQIRDEQANGMTMFARNLAEGGHLRRGLTIEHARDVLCTIHSADVYELLILRAGWSDAAYVEFIVQSLIANLLDPTR